jgi:hypothetical protein
MHLQVPVGTVGLYAIALLLEYLKLEPALVLPGLTAVVLVLTKKAYDPTAPTVAPDVALSTFAVVTRLPAVAAVVCVVASLNVIVVPLTVIAIITPYAAVKPVV